MIGTRLLDRYKLTSVLGRGGMGTVYRAFDPVLDREVAVKVLPPGYLQPETEKRFRHEAKAVARMDHPGIVPIHDFGHHEESLFLVMPVVQGETLRSLVRGGGLSLGELLEIVAQAADALDYSHALGVVHRDVKPENVMVSRERGGLRVRVMDFGLARGLSAPRVTDSGGILGTLAYMSPEQISGEPLDGRSDLYSLGALLYECLAGEPPFTGPVHVLVLRIVNEEPRTLRERGVEADEALGDLVMACLAREPAQRPASGRELAQALRRCAARLGGEELAQAVGLAVKLSGELGRERRPLVGRTAEVRELRARLQAALAGECQLVLLEGDAGIGKTRLLEEVEDMARARGIRVLQARFAERQSALPYQGLCELVQDFFRVRETTTSSSGVPDLSDLAPELLALFPMFAELDELRPVAGSGAPPATAARRDDAVYVFELFGRTLSRLAGGKPLVLLLDNLHAGDVSVEGLEYLVRRLRLTPTLIVGTFRPAEIDRGHPLHRLLRGFADDPRSSRLALSPLSAGELTELTELELRPAGGSERPGELDEAALGQLYEVSEGNPLFALEILRSLRDTGSLRRDASGRWVIAERAAIADDALPQTIQQAIERRVGRLPEAHRKVLAVAAVLGRDFDFDDLQALSGDNAGDGDGLDEVVDRLVADGLLEEDRAARGDRLRFASGVVRDVLYHQVPRRRRRLLHRRHAYRLEERHADRLERVYPQLVYHFSEGDVAGKTVVYGLELAHRSLRAMSPEDALRAARTALEFADEDDVDRGVAARGELLLAMARAERLARHLDAALRHAERALTAFEEAAEPGAAAAAALLLAETAWQARRVDVARRWVERGCELARGRARAGGEGAVETLETLKNLLTLGATAANLRGDHAAAQQYLEEAERLAPAAPAPAADAAPGRTRRGGEIHVPLPGRVESLDPTFGMLAEYVEAIPNVFETLTRVEEGARIVPWLAEAYEARDGGRSYYFRLRDVRFHDGRQLTARDVRYSFERVLTTPKSDIHFVLLPIRGARALRAGEAGELAGFRILSPNELVIELERPLAFFPALLTHQVAAIVPQGCARFASHWRGGCAGTGPFRVLRCEAGERLDLERHPDYWRLGYPKCDRLTFHFALTPERTLADFRQGRLSLASDLRPADVEALRRDPEFTGGYRESPRLATYFLVLNARRGPFADLAARCVFVRDLDVDTPLREAAGSLATRAHGLIPPGLPGNEDTAPPRPEAPDGVTALHGLRLNAAIHPVYAGQYAAFWQRLGEAARAARLAIESQERSPADALALARDGAVDLVAFRWVADYPDADGFVGNLLHSDEGSLAGIAGHPQIDRLIERGRRETEASLRHVIYREIEETIAREALLVPLFHEQIYRFRHPTVRGFRFGINTPEVRYEELYASR